MSRVLRATIAGSHETRRPRHLLSLTETRRCVRIYLSPPFSNPWRSRQGITDSRSTARSRQFGRARPRLTLEHPSQARQNKLGIASQRCAIRHLFHPLFFSTWRRISHLHSIILKSPHVPQTPVDFLNRLPMTLCVHLLYPIVGESQRDVHQHLFGYHDLPTQLSASRLEMYDSPRPTRSRLKCPCDNY